MCLANELVNENVIYNKTSKDLFLAEHLVTLTGGVRSLQSGCPKMDSWIQLISFQ